MSEEDGRKEERLFGQLTVAELLDLLNRAEGNWLCLLTTNIFYIIEGPKLTRQLLEIRCPFRLIVIGPAAPNILNRSSQTANRSLPRTQGIKQLFDVLSAIRSYVDLENSWIRGTRLAMIMDSLTLKRLTVNFDKMVNTRKGSKFGKSEREEPKLAKGTAVLCIYLIFKCIDWWHGRVSFVIVWNTNPAR